MPVVSLDLSFSVSLRVRNKNFFSLNYNFLGVSVGYRGRRLGYVSSEGGRVSARGSSYVNATLDLNGLEVVHDVLYLLADLGKGIIPFDTETDVEGSMGLFFIKIPIKVMLILFLFLTIYIKSLVGIVNCFYVDSFCFFD